MKKTFGLFALAAFALVGCSNAGGMSIPDFSWKGDGSDSAILSGDSSDSGATSIDEGGEWSKEIQDAMKDTIGYVLPYFTGFEESTFYFENYPADDEYYAYFELGDEAETDTISESNYAELLTSKGFEEFYFLEEEGYGLELDDGMSLLFVRFGYYGGNYIIADLIDDYDGGDEVDIDLDPSEFLPGDTMTFGNEGYMIHKGSEISYWAVGTNVMVIEQGSSQTTVGNKSFYSNPLRVYAGQVITFLFLDDVPSSIVVNCTTNSYANALYGEVEGATVMVSETNVTFTVDDDVQSVVVAPSAQTRLNSVHFVA